MHLFKLSNMLLDLKSILLHILWLIVIKAVFLKQTNMQNSPFMLSKLLFHKEVTFLSILFLWSWLTNPKTFCQRNIILKTRRKKRKSWYPCLCGNSQWTSFRNISYENFTHTTSREYFERHMQYALELSQLQKIERITWFLRLNESKCLGWCWGNERSIL